MSLDGVGNLALELEQDTFSIFRKGQEERQSWEQERETERHDGHQSLGHQPSSAVRESSSGHSLDDHRLQEAETHH